MKPPQQIPAREVPAAINWHDGMLLAPQHFQHLCLRLERLGGNHGLDRRLPLVHEGRGRGLGQ